MEETLPSWSLMMVTRCQCSCPRIPMSMLLTGSPPSVASWLLKIRRKQWLQNLLDNYELKFCWISGGNPAIRYISLIFIKFGYQKLKLLFKKKGSKWRLHCNLSCSLSIFILFFILRIYFDYIVKTCDFAAEHLVYLYILFVVTIDVSLPNIKQNHVQLFKWTNCLVYVMPILPIAFNQ